jgi:Tfp pilus assembly protein PilZ
MEKAPASAASAMSSRKTPARAALVDLKDPARGMIVECFRQFGVETVLMGTGAEDRLRKEKFEACVVKLTPAAEPLMEAARTSASNSRIVIYGLGGTAQEAMRFSKYGINAIFREPLERPAAMKLVRATQMLVQHELRRYVRIPVITEVTVVLTEGNQRLTATSLEVSSGGMSMKSAESLQIGQAVEVSFSLLTLPRVFVRGNVAWRNAPGRTFGVRFDNTDDRRQRIKDWIEAYLEN